MKKQFASLILASFFCLVLGGCATSGGATRDVAGGLSDFGSAVRSNFNGPTTNASLGDYVLPKKVSSEEFVSHARMVAEDQGFDVGNVAHTPNGVVMVLVKRSSAFAIGPVWSIVVTLTLQSDQRTVSIAPTVTSNKSIFGKGPDSTDEIIGKIKGGLEKQFPV